MSLAAASTPSVCRPSTPANPANRPQPPLKSGRTAQQKSDWTNKFRSPSVEDLRGGYAKAALPVFDAVRELLLSLDVAGEAVTWHGVPWRWTLVYGKAGGVGGGGGKGKQTRAFAYLIPDPERLQLCVPLTADCLAVLPVKRFKKQVRDAIVHARTVAGTSWPTWDVPSKGALEDLEDLLRRKHRQLRSPTEGLAVGA